MSFYMKSELIQNNKDEVDKSGVQRDYIIKSRHYAIPMNCELASTFIFKQIVRGFHLCYK